MSLRGRNQSGQDIGLKSVIAFLSTLWCMSAGIAVLAVIGMALSALAGQNLIVYQMTLAVDAVMLAGGGLGLRTLQRKDRQFDKLNGHEFDEMEKEQ